MRWSFYTVMLVLALSVGLTPSFGQSMSTYQVADPQNSATYPVNYQLTGGTVKDMSLDINATSLIISLQMAGDGNLTVALPRTVIDAKMGANDDQFFVLVDGADTNFQESKTNTVRTISVPVIDGTERVEIIGTQVVPEFGSLSVVILVLSVISIIAITARSRIRI